MDQVYSKWEALKNFLLKLQAIKPTIQGLQDKHCNNLPIKITSIQHFFINLQTYVTWLESLHASLMTRAELEQMQHPSIFLDSFVHPVQLAEPKQPDCMQQSKACGFAKYPRLNSLPSMALILCQSITWVPSIGCSNRAPGLMWHFAFTPFTMVCWHMLYALNPEPKQSTWKLNTASQWPSTRGL